MRGLTLPWSGFKAHPLPSSPKPTLNHRATTCLVSSFNSLSKNHIPSLSFSWDSRLGFGRRIILPPVCANEDGLEIGFVDSKYRNVTRESMYELDDCFDSDDSLVRISSRRKYHKDMVLIFSDPLFGGLSKFMLCFGLLTLQGSQPAIAGTDFGSGLQSIPLLGDLGDISTGILAYLLLGTGGQDLLHCGTSSC